MIKLNLIGHRFGKLTVISEAPKEKGKIHWNCVCDCGGSKVASTELLRRGNCNSCGCLLYEYLAERHSKTDTDITGIRFGRLVALHKLDDKRNGSITWLCQCDCGEQVPAAASELKKGHTRSCGCLLTEHLQSLSVGGTNVPSILADKLNARNTSGVKGVWFDTRRNKWTAEIMFRRKRYRLGRYDTIGDAAQVRKEAEERLHGEFLEWYNSREE